MRTLALIALAPAVTAFAPATPAPRAVALQSAVEEVIEVVEAVIEDVDVKDELLSVVGAAVGDSVSSDLRDEVSELLVKMEAKNPTEEPATSALLNGVWDVAYQGYAPGPLPSPTRPLALALYAGGFTPGVRRSVLGFLCRLDGVASMASRRRRRVRSLSRPIVVASMASRRRRRGASSRRRRERDESERNRRRRRRVDAGHGDADTVSRAGRGPHGGAHAARRFS